MVVIIIFMTFIRIFMITIHIMVAIHIFVVDNHFFMIDNHFFKVTIRVNFLINFIKNLKELKVASTHPLHFFSMTGEFQNFC